MDLYFAPLEGITTYIYRNTHAAFFGGCDAYYAPFITPTDNEKLSAKSLRDILPERNDGLNLKVQVLTNTSTAFFKFTDKIKNLGYSEVNINLGCPSNTVCKKGRGAAFLRDTDGLDRFLYEIFCANDIKVSIKTRIGYTSSDEMDKLLEIYNKYPLSLLIIHPRTRDAMYKGVPDMAAFAAACIHSQHELCYNGNIYSVSDYKCIPALSPKITSVMIGRGAIANPAIFREIKGGARLTTDELLTFTDTLIANYNSVLKSDTYTLHKLKEIWIYAIDNYPNEKKIAKALRKSTKLGDFRKALDHLPEI